MSSLRFISNSDLLNAVARLAREERRITLEVLEHFREIERRKAYADLNYASLFEYAVGHLHYSEGSASRRIAAMRAIKEHPELREKIQTGQTTITSIAKIQTTLRKEEKISSEKISIEEKKKIFAELAELSTREIERRLADIAPEASVQERTRPIGSDLHEVKVYLNSEELETLTELQGWYAHSLKNPDSKSEVFQRLIRMAKEQFLKEFGPKKSKAALSTADQSSKNASPAEQEKPMMITKAGRASRRDASPAPALISSGLSKRTCELRRRIPATVRRTVFNRAQFRCEYIDATGQRCHSKHFVQIDHVIPHAKGGSDRLENLKLLCRNHNLIRGIREFGAKRMRRNE